MSMNRPFPINATLTAIAIGYRNPSASLIYDKVLPAVPVYTEKFGWLSFPIEEAFTVPELQVGRTSQPGKVSFTAEDNEGRVKHYGLDDLIPITDIDEAAAARARKVSTFDPEANSVEGLTSLIQLGREVRAAKVVQDPNNYDAARRVVLAGNQQFNDFANSDPFEVMNACMRKPLIYRANTIAMSEDVWETIKRHPKLLKAVKGGLAEEGAINRQQFAELMEIKPENLLIGAGMVNVATKGQPVDLRYAWGKSIQFLHIDPAKKDATDNVLTWGFTAENGKRMAGTILNPNVGIKGGNQLRVAEMVEEIVCAKSLGCIIQNAIA
jgi:hypothetical protein